MDLDIRLILFCLTIAMIAVVKGQSPCDWHGSMGDEDGIELAAHVLIINAVPENRPVGSTIVNLKVEGGDEQTDLTELSTSNSGPFGFDPVSRDITVESPIQHAQSGFKFDISCTVRGSNAQNTLLVLINTLDLNDHEPVFLNAPYYANISEYAPVGSTVISSISATDEDSSNPFVRYSVLPGPFSDHFEFPLPSLGRLTLSKMVDFEEIQVITLNIQVTDTHRNSDVVLSSNTTVTVQIFDENDQNPVFNHHTYMASVPETESIGAVISTNPRILAHDPDIWQNSTLEYSIVEDPDYREHEYFDMDSSSGELTLARDALQRGNKFCLLIQVTKATHPDRYTQALVRVAVQPANSSPPRFIETVYMATLVENTVIGSPVVTVKAIDNDEISMPGDVPEDTLLRYAFAENYPNFAIDAANGAITTAQTLNFDDDEEFTLIVEVTDGQNSDEAEVRVTILAVNKYNPVFPQSYYEFNSEDIEPNTAFLRLQATDTDKSSSITYSFLHEAANTNFTINAVTGEIFSTTNELKAYSLVVIASDNGTPPRQASCLIRIIGEQEPVVPVNPAPAKSSSDDGGDSNMVAIIVLSILAAILFVVIVVMAICIVRNDQDSSQSKSRCVRSQSFEQNPMNFSSKNYKSYLDPVTNYKPNDRHLQLYNGVTIGESTSTQENPFSSQNSLDENDVGRATQYSRGNIRDLPSHSAAVDAGLYPQQYPLDGATMGDSSVDRQSGSTLPRNRSAQIAHQAHIEYDTALSPMDVDAKRLNGFHGYSNQSGYQNYVPHAADPNMEGSPRSSMNSENSYNHGELTSFKVGSTTQLVPSSHNIPKSSRSINKGSGNISFVDNSPSNSMYSSLTSQQSGLDPGNAMEHQGRSGITVYY